MSQAPKGASAGRVTVGRAALDALKTDLARERETARRLQLELTAEIAFARKAAEETITARSEREEYRRVLAAAVANEKRALEVEAEAREEVERVTDSLRESERALGEARGRATELDQMVSTLRAERERDLGLVIDRARTDAATSAAELERAAHGRGVALGQLRELLRRVPEELSDTARLAKARARVALISAGFLLFLFVLFLYPLLFMLFGGAEAQPALALGISGWGVLGIELGLLACALALGSFALRELRAMEQAGRADEEGGDGEPLEEVVVGPGS